jgi:bifunctional DNA-binding transcriptional regulator/antitoxin component of YhaV-PrlF toxin-antitoxin module
MGKMIKIHEYKIQRQGMRGFALPIPKVWVMDNKLSQGDSIEFYRDEEDHLILVSKKAPRDS